MVRTLALTLFFLTSATAVADILYPHDAFLREKVGVGIDAYRVVPGGNAASVKTVSILADTSFDDEEASPLSVWTIDFYRSQSSYTRTTKRGAKAGGSYYGFSFAASYNKSITESRKTDDVNATFFYEAITRRTTLNADLLALSKVELSPDVQRMLDEAQSAFENDRLAELLAIQEQFYAKYGSGLLYEIQRGASFFVEYSRAKTDNSTIMTRERDVELAYLDATGSIDNDDSVDQGIKTHILNYNGTYVGHPSTGVAPTTFKQAITAFSQSKAGEPKNDWADKVAENPVNVRYRYFSYHEIPILRLLVNPRRSLLRSMGTAIDYMDGTIPQSTAFVAYQSGWGQWSFGTVPKLIPTTVHIGKNGLLSITYAIEREPLLRCDPDANLLKLADLQTAPNAAAELCASSNVTASRIPHWLDYRENTNAEYREAALRIHDPKVPRKTILKPLILTKSNEIPDTDSYPLLVDPAAAINDEMELRALINKLDEGSGGYRATYRLTDKQLAIVRQKLRDGDLVIQTIARIESDTEVGPPVSLLPYELGVVDIPDVGGVNLEYTVVPKDSYDELVAFVDGQNVEFIERTKLQLYESGCSREGMEYGKETCRKRIVIPDRDSNTNCRNGQGSTQLNVRGSPISHPKADGCTYLAMCRFEPYKGNAHLAGGWAEYRKHHFAAPNEAPAGGANGFVAYITCKNNPTGRYVVEPPLPVIDFPTTDGLVDPAVAQ